MKTLEKIIEDNSCWTPRCILMLNKYGGNGLTLNNYCKDCREEFAKEIREWALEQLPKELKDADIDYTLGWNDCLKEIKSKFRGVK